MTDLVKHGRGEARNITDASDVKRSIHAQSKTVATLDVGDWLT